MTPDREVTLVCTSCGRYDLLDRTLDSFFTYNTFHVKHFIVIEDGQFTCARLREKYPATEFLETGKRVGQIDSIDMAYELVRTPYVFHCEDDWEFHRTGFIEQSLDILEKNARIIQVWLRDRLDMHGMRAEREYQLAGETKWYYVKPTYKWHGFSFNPGLKRMSDYKRYGSITRYVKSRPTQAEADISAFYFKLGFRAAILEHGHIKHIGYGRHVE